MIAYSAQISQSLKLVWIIPLGLPLPCYEMHSCDYIRGFKGKPEVPVSSSNLINKILQRNGSDKQPQQHSHHKSHEILTERKPEFSRISEDKSSIARHDKTKRHSRSEDNLLDLTQKIMNPSASGQVILSQDFFMVSRKREFIRVTRN